ncbi:pilus assembly PilX family protein [Acinetobacter proteolyticus]|uniref:Pilus assembly protein PilX n=1 Tax=Acinetobacter proteolyticus TaxID=1776741 RepID=A0A2N0WJW8_9GAMM|nr:pilus assembly PilX N-terminal domain-containing protein [Acinetobacter proteolyticus]MBK5647736.1 pilus assembly PilX N-terminal domain-containing protein [Acinetobacter sp.]PKF36744.1 pilus assembly protein PilX [Acinetobacter proteolyticus]
MRYAQRGSTLVVVLMIVLMITIIGTLAIRQSISSLRLVSNHQMQTLLAQNADAALMYFQDPSSQQYMASANGIVGFFKNENNKDAELVFCFSGTDPFVLSKASYRLNSSTFEPMTTNSGACKVDPNNETNDTASRSSGRKQVVTQIYIKRELTPTAPFADLSRGTETLGAKTENNIRLRVYVVSVMQGLLTSDALFKSDRDITKGCLTKSIDNNGSNDVAACLKQNTEKPIYNIQVAEYRFLSDFEPSSS